jgi:hypothetical protein
LFCLFVFQNSGRCTWTDVCSVDLVDMYAMCSLCTQP